MSFGFACKIVDSPATMLPLQIFISIQPSWLLTRIKAQLPPVIQWSKGTVAFGNIVSISKIDSLIGLQIDLELNINGPMKSKVSGVVQLDIYIDSLADWNAIETRIPSYRWINGPKVRWLGLPFGFAKKRVNIELDKQLHRAPKMIAETIKLKIKEWLNHSKFRPLELPSLQAFDDKVHFLELETIWYQSQKENELLQFGIFPSVSLYLGNNELPSDVAAIKLEPGVGGNQCQANVTFSEDQVNKLVKENMIGRKFEIKNFDFTINDVVVVCGEKKLDVVCHFKEYPLAPLELELALMLNEVNQVLSFDLIEFSWNPKNLLLKAIILFFRNRIVKEFEERLNVDLKSLLSEQLNAQKARVEKELLKEKLVLNNWTPSIFVSSLEIAPEKINASGQLIGQVYIQSKEDPDELKAHPEGRKIS